MTGPHGVLLGVNPAATYVVGETGLPPGSTISSTPTALTEAENARGEMFGDRRALDLLNASRQRDAAGLIDDRRGGGRKLSPRDSRRSDDLTLLALRYALLGRHSGEPRSFQSTRAPDSLITLPHFAVSDLM